MVVSTIKPTILGKVYQINPLTQQFFFPTRKESWDRKKRGGGLEIHISHPP